MDYFILTSISLSNAYKRHVYRPQIPMDLTPTFRHIPTLKPRVPLPDLMHHLPILGLPEATTISHLYIVNSLSNVISPYS